MTKEEWKVYLKAYRAKNKERLNAQQRARNLANHEIVLVKEQERRPLRAAYYAANPDKARARGKNRGWSKANPEKAFVAYSKWKREHPEQLRIRSAVTQSKRRALKYANTPISEMLTSTEWLAILAEANGHCAYCDKEAKLTLDHVIPLSRGGKH